MANIFYFLSTAGTNSGQTTGSSSFMTMFLPLIIIFVLFYFLLIIPQKRQQKKHQEMLNSIEKGDEVVTTGGIHGKVVASKDTTIIIKVDDNTSIEFSKGAIAKVIKKGER